jgi:hypothetical protein
MIENEWRMEYCPDYGFAYCNCPFTDNDDCPGAWNCADIGIYAEEMMMYYDTNNDGNVNLSDDIEEGHVNMIME